MFKLNKLEKSWAFYDWANSAYTMTVTSTIMPLYFKSLFTKSGGNGALSTAYWGYANSIATLIIALLAPILGTIADYKGFKKKFFTVFVSLGLITTVALSFVDEQYWSILLACYILTAIGFSGANIFYDAFLVDVTTKDRMDKVSTYGFALGYIGSTIPFILCMAIVILAGKNIIPITVTLACKVSFVLTALWWAVFTLPMYKRVKQIHGIKREKHVVKNSFARIYKTFKDIKKHKKLFMFLLAYFFYIDGVSTIIKMATSYGADLGVSSTNLLVILLVTQFVAFPCAIIYGKLADKFSTLTMIYTGIIIYIIICVYAYFLDSVLDFWILAMLVGSSQGGIQALSRSYFAKLVPKNNANEFFGFYNVFGKFAAIMGPSLLGVITHITGKTNYGVCSIILLFIIGGILLTRVNKQSVKNVC
ncbi:MFS transporter [Clostridiaceae bacterium M8S5]|nr:MFS transporter [Clostridiaceae bacterium M8S5]